MTALDGEHDPLLTALRSTRFDSLQDTTLLGFSPSEHSAAGNAICCISLFGKVFIIDRWNWVGKLQLTRKNREGDEEEFHAAAYLWTSSSLVLPSLELLHCPPLASDGV